MGKTVVRHEDMSPDGWLQLYWQDDGDIIVVVKPEGEGEIPHSVEFCNSGGRSPNTLKALRDLFTAMEVDNSRGAT